MSPTRAARTALALPIALAVSAGCGSPAAPPPPASPPPAPPAPAPVAPAPTPDPLRCELAVRVVGVGDGAGGVSAPVFVGDGVLFAYLRLDDSGDEALIARRMSLAGELGPEHVLARARPVGVPRLVVHDGRAAVTISTRESTRLVPLDRDGAIDAAARVFPLARGPEAITLGPRGVVAVGTDADAVARIAPDGAALAPVPLPRSPLMPEPQEELVASGPEVDLVLHRSGTFESPAITAHVIGREGELARHELGVDLGASAAVGPSGFLVVSSVPDEGWRDLTLRLFDARGAPHGEPIHVPAGPAAEVRGYARAAALGDGWAITFWDGIGPSLLRVDASGHVLGEALPLRSGDERGGHTEARLATHDGTIAITWEVHPPAFGHGAPEEQPEHPGPRIALATCAR